MRDPNRIEEVILALETYWVDHPDMRLGQIICNAARAFDEEGNYGPIPDTQRIFNMEEPRLLEGLKALSK